MLCHVLLSSSFFNTTSYVRETRSSSSGNTRAGSPSAPIASRGHRNRFVFVTRRAGWLSVVKLDASCSRHAPHRHNGLDLFVYQLCDSPQQEVATAMNNFWKKICIRVLFDRLSFNCLLFSFKEICKIFRPSLCKTYLFFLKFLQFTSIACQLVPILIINGVTLALLLAFQFDALPFLLLSFLGLLLRPGLVLLLRGSRTFSPWPNARLPVLFQLTLSRLLSDFVSANKNSSLTLMPILRQKRLFTCSWRHWDRWSAVRRKMCSCSSIPAFLATSTDRIPQPNVQNPNLHAKKSTRFKNIFSNKF